MIMVHAQQGLVSMDSSIVKVEVDILFMMLLIICSITRKCLLF